MDPIISVEGLEKSYGRTRALDGVTLSVEPGQLYGLLGPNGAGKSTLVKIACGLVRSTRGRVRVCGGAPRATTTRRNLGYLAELFRFPGWLTAGEVLEMHQRFAESAGKGAERAELLDLVGLSDSAARRVEAMSKGMQQRLGIAQALIGSPQLLILDEPTSALDPAGRHVVRGLLEELKGRGTSVLLNSHLLSEVELVCDQVAILLDGRIVAEGSPKDLVGVEGVDVETGSGRKRFEQAGRDDVPDIVARLVAAGERIYSVRPARRTLEDVYLEAVKGRTG